MSTRVQRDSYDGQKIHHSSGFELCYLRHKYLRKTNTNPTREEMAPYSKTINDQSRRTLLNYYDLFKLLGFELEDIINIGNVHLVSFLGLFSIESDPYKFHAFKKAFGNLEFREPEKEDILNKNKANFTIFLKQRFDDLVRVCGQKGRNIKGLHTEGYLVFAGPDKPPIVIYNLIKNYEKLGFKKISLPIFKSIRKQVKDKHNSVFQFGGLWYVCVSVEQKELRLTDLCGAGQDPYDNFHTKNPEEVCELKLVFDKWQQFEKFSKRTKIHKLRRFIKDNQNNVSYKDEVSAAKKILKEISKETRKELVALNG